MGGKLLIVESPAKARTIGKYLGSGFSVKSSVGHVRDLPPGDGAIAIEKNGEGSWRFVPTYEVSPGKKKVVAELKKAAKAADEIYLASDPDREGEAIAWHLKEVLAGDAKGKPFRRVAYNEITKNAVLKAVSEPRDIDMPLVDAQQARRILDRIVGYRVSPLLWRNIHCANSRQLSAGRVQSVALRLLVERQREIDAFVPETYYLMGVEAEKNGAKETFTAKLSRLDGEKPEIKDKTAADGMLLDLSGAGLSVSALKSQPKTRRPLPPFTTSTLQQAASSVLGFSPGKTMKLAQSLYEQGHITYMRTDSVNVSDSARAAARNLVETRYGKEYYPARKPNLYKSKAGAQGAHEAIRPTDVEAGPGTLGLDAAEQKLYDLVWRRFVASQMAEAKTTVRTVLLKASKSGLAHEYVFSASATDIDFDGFLKVMRLPDKKKDEDGEDADGDEVQALPELSEGEELAAVRWLSDEKKTKGPAHYSEASLIKTLEENGVGRPSTYAATIETLKAREYAKTEKRKLVPLERGILVSDWLVSKLDSLFNVGYTARMESELDEVESGGVTMDAMLSAFYGKFEKEVAACAEAAPERKKIEEVFELLSHVREWKAPVKAGGRTYDDKAFVESVRKQMESGKTVTARQYGFLARMVQLYASQIPGAAEKMAEWKSERQQTPDAGPSIDPAVVKECFEALKRLPGQAESPFVRSLREQFERGRVLSRRQVAALARMVGEKCSDQEWFSGLAVKLAGWLPAENAVAREEQDPAIADLLEAMRGVKQWRDKIKRGRRTYDDKEFVESLASQFASRRSLTGKQSAALRRLVVAYKKQIPGYSELSAKYGLEDGVLKRSGGDGDGDGS